jgi:hypothetical protein
MLGQDEGDFKSDPFHVMPIEEVFWGKLATWMHYLYLLSSWKD